MMPGSLSRVNARVSGLTRTEVKQSLTSRKANLIQPELERLCEETLSLRMEIARLTEDNHDLRESAKIWIRLYEGHLVRGNRAVSKLAAVSGDAVDLETGIE